ncbi:MAG TPA: tetronasin resistance protein, partial [Bacillota bacterium]|nr:tetronasin resistance protein [Bacillota bacterium]
KVTRAKLFWTSVGLAIFAGLIGILLAAGGLGGTAVTVMGDQSTMDIVDFFATGFNLLPTVLFFTSLAALALGWIPKLGKAVYIYLAYSFLLTYFEGILDLPEWFSKTAIQSWMPSLPMEDFEITIFIVISVISIVLMVVGYLGYKRRDLIEGT